MKPKHLIVILVVFAAVAIVTTDAHAMYHPRMGRFLQRDPGPGAAGPMRVGAGGPAMGGGFAQRDPVSQYADGMSLYQYVRSSPMRYADPSGYQSTQPSTQPTTRPACVCGPEVTEWFTEEINIHAKFWRDIRRNIGPLLRPLYFRKYGAHIPYKWTKFETTNCPSGGPCKGTVMLCGSCIHRSELGNIMLGATAKLFVRGERIIIGAVGQLGANGPDSIQDMSGVVAGMSLDGSVRSGNIDRDSLCRLLKSDQSQYINTIRSAFKPDSPMAELLGKLSGNNLNDMGSPYEDCQPCQDQFTMGHSDFSWLKTTRDVASGDWTQTYPNLPVGWPEGFVPRSQTP